MAQHLAGAARGLEQPQEQADGRGLARAIGAQEGRDGPFGNPQVQSFDSGQLPEPPAEPIRLDRQGHLSPR